MQINWCWRGEWPTEEAAAAPTTSKCLANIAAAHAHSHLTPKWITYMPGLTQYLVPRRCEGKVWVGGPFYFVTRTHAGFIKRRTSRCFSPALSKRRLLIPPSCWRNRLHKTQEERAAAAPPLLLPRDEERPACTLAPRILQHRHCLLESTCVKFHLAHRQERAEMVNFLFSLMMRWKSRSGLPLHRRLLDWD